MKQSNFSVGDKVQREIPLEHIWDIEAII